MKEMYMLDQITKYYLVSYATILHGMIVNSLILNDNIL